MHAFVRPWVLLMVWTVGVGCAGEVFGAQGRAKGKAATPDVPRELAIRPLPTYRIEPPDTLQIEVLKLVPLQPYKVGIYDVLQIRVLGTMTDQPIDGFFLVDGEGVVALGPAYRKVPVVGMTIKEIEAAVEKKLKQIVTKPEASVQLARSGGTQAVSGQYLVAPDGTVNLRRYGTVQVMGKTVEEAAAAVRKQLSKYLTSPEVTVDVLAYNSKVYYIITEGAGLGDNVRRVPITGKETVLDALGVINGLSQVSSTRMWVARPSPSNPANGTILPVDYAGITQRGATATNYQIMPGDRLFIAEDRTAAVNNWLTKKTTSIERVLGLISLGASTIKSVEKLLPDQPKYPPGTTVPGQ